MISLLVFFYAQAGCALEKKSPAFNKEGKAPPKPHPDSFADQAGPSKDYSGESVAPAQLKKAILLSAKYLVKANKASGQFVYRVNLNPEVTPRPKYNMLRHAGTMYALAMHNQLYPDADTREVLLRAARFLMKNTVAPLPGRDDLLAVWSYPEISGSSKPVQAKLGGTGLGLVALLSLEKVHPGTTSMDVLRKMGRFILFMQKEDGSFYSKYIPDEGGRTDKWTSLYYPGEAALGLLMLYEKDPSLQWLQAAANAIAYLARIRAEKRKVAADHWALLATAKLLPVYGRCKNTVSRQEVLQHARQVCESILSAINQHPDNTPEYGCLTGDGRTCPTATRLEGLLAALSFLPAESKALQERITSAANRAMAFLLRSQIPAGAFAGGIPRAIRPLPAGHPRFNKSFNRRSTEVRIDYVQHALSAMIQYDRMFFFASHKSKKNKPLNNNFHAEL